MKFAVFPLIALISLLKLFSSSSATSVTLSLSRVTISPTTTKLEELNRLAVASSFRAHHLKEDKLNVNAYLFARSYGEYSISLNFGTPPQTMSVIMDTGSSVVWLPCTKQYLCNICNFPGLQPEDQKTFDPNTSSSSTNVTCKSPKIERLIPEFKPAKNCSAGRVLSYNISYGSGNTTGKYLFESLTFPEIRQRYDDFLIGCSLTSYRIPSGIAGFGRRPYSLPSQMALDSFSYCLLSHQYDDNGTLSSDLVLTKGKKSAVPGIVYTQFAQNPNISLKPGLKHYYYVPLKNISVGAVEVKGLEKAKLPDELGNGGTIVDSGTTFTFMENSLFDLFAKEFQKQVAGKYKRNSKAENETGSGLCFDVPINGSSLPDMPKIRFGFEGGAVMDLPLENYIVIVDDSAGGTIGCLTFITSIPALKGKPPQGPAMILGNYLQQNFHMEYDLKNNRLGILPTNCMKK